MSSIPAQTKGLPPPGPPYPFWLGGVAATCAVCFTHPLDAVKNRLQTQTGVRQSMGAVLVTTARQEGLRGIYQGLSASVLRQLTYSLARFAAYDDLKNRLAKRSPDGHISNTSLALSAMAAGVIGGVAGNPAGSSAPPPPTSLICPLLPDHRPLTTGVCARYHASAHDVGSQQAAGKALQLP